MARGNTLAGLRAEVRGRADIENDPHYTDAEINRFINQSCAALHALLCDVNEGFFRTQATYPTVAGAETLAVSKDPNTGADNGFYKLINVEINANGVWGKLGRASDEQRTRARGYPSAPRGYQLRRAQGGTVTLLLVPVPDAVYSIVVTFLPSFVDLVADGDLYDGLDGWEEWVVLDAAIKCALKEESSTVDLKAERLAVEGRIRTQMAIPDLDHPPVIRDTERDGAWLDWPPRPYDGGGI